MLTILATLALAQQTKPPTPEEAYIGGHLEAVAGIKLHGIVVFGQYQSRVSRPDTELSGYYELNPKDTLARTPVRVGSTGWKVSNSMYDGKPCLLLETDGIRNKVRQYRNDNGIDTNYTTPVQRYRKVWVSTDGIPLHEQSGFRNQSATYELDAIFKKDEIELTTAGPKGKRTTTIYPAGGIDLFANEFKPMIDGEKILLPEKKFSRLDPVSGGVVQITAKVGPKFEGMVFQKKFTGYRIDFTVGDHSEVAFVSNAMDLLQVNIPHGESLLPDMDPTEGKSDVKKIKAGGGR